LKEVTAMSAEEAWARADTGAPKLFMIKRALEALSKVSDADEALGSYTPLEARGGGADHIVAFGRGRAFVVVVPRLVMSLGGWDDTTLTLPWGRWMDVFTGAEIDGTVSIDDLLGRFPVAFLTRDTR
jgi:(1->4)-alpha-D-glucan 1-alpha-D-glucosylmutase